jgi:hypothetical protein
MSQSAQQNDQTRAAPAFSPEELARRRQVSRRVAWALGAAALLFYIAGFFLKR